MGTEGMKELKPLYRGQEIAYRTFSGRILYGIIAGELRDYPLLSVRSKESYPGHNRVFWPIGEVRPWREVIL